MAPARVGDYILFETLGSGAFGTVRAAIHAPTGAAVAVKVLSKAAVRAAGQARALRREAAIMRGLRHPNVVSLRAALTSADHVYLVLDLVEGPDLFEAIAATDGRGLPEPRARALFAQLAAGVAYCHARGVFHRDLKPENVLLHAPTDTLRIADFGLAAAPAHDLLATRAGTPHYLPPEVLRADAPAHYSGEKLDAWACGVVLFALLAGHLPFDGDDLVADVCAAAPRYPPAYPPAARSLTRQLLHPDPARRLSVARAAGHAWLRDAAAPAPPPAPSRAPPRTQRTSAVWLAAHADVPRDAQEAADALGRIGAAGSFARRHRLLPPASPVEEMPLPADAAGDTVRALRTVQSVIAVARRSLAEDPRPGAAPPVPPGRGCIDATHVVRPRRPRAVSAVSAASAPEAEPAPLPRPEQPRRWSLFDRIVASIRPAAQASPRARAPAAAAVVAVARVELGARAAGARPPLADRERRAAGRRQRPRTSLAPPPRTADDEYVESDSDGEPAHAARWGARGPGSPPAPGSSASTRNSLAERLSPPSRASRASLASDAARAEGVSDAVATLVALQQLRASLAAAPAAAPGDGNGAEFMSPAEREDTLRMLGVWEARLGASASPHAAPRQAAWQPSHIPGVTATTAATATTATTTTATPGPPNPRLDPSATAAPDPGDTAPAPAAPAARHSVTDDELLTFQRTLRTWDDHAIGESGVALELPLPAPGMLRVDDDAALEAGVSPKLFDAGVQLDLDAALPGIRVDAAPWPVVMPGAAAAAATAPGAATTADPAGASRDGTAPPAAGLWDSWNVRVAPQDGSVAQVDGPPAAWPVASPDGHGADGFAADGFGADAAPADAWDSWPAGVAPDDEALSRIAADPAPQPPLSADFPHLERAPADAAMPPAHDEGVYGATPTPATPADGVRHFLDSTAGGSPPPPAMDAMFASWNAHVSPADEMQLDRAEDADAHADADAADPLALSTSSSSTRSDVGGTGVREAAADEIVPPPGQDDVPSAHARRAPSPGSAAPHAPAAPPLQASSSAISFALSLSRAARSDAAPQPSPPPASLVMAPQRSGAAPATPDPPTPSASLQSSSMSTTAGSSLSANLSMGSSGGSAPSAPPAHLADARAPPRRRPRTPPGELDAVARFLASAATPSPSGSAAALPTLPDRPRAAPPSPGSPPHHAGRSASATLSLGSVFASSGSLDPARPRAASEPAHPPAAPPPSPEMDATWCVPPRRAAPPALRALQLASAWRAAPPPPPPARFYAGYPPAACMRELRATAEFLGCVPAARPACARSGAPRLLVLVRPRRAPHVHVGLQAAPASERGTSVVALLHAPGAGKAELAVFARFGAELLDRFARVCPGRSVLLDDDGAPRAVV